MIGLQIHVYIYSFTISSMSTMSQVYWGKIKMKKTHPFPSGLTVKSPSVSKAHSLCRCCGLPAFRLSFELARLFFTGQWGRCCLPVLRVRKPRFRDAKSLAQGDTASKRQAWNLNPCHVIINPSSFQYATLSTIPRKCSEISRDRDQVEDASSLWLYDLFL